MKLRNKKTGEIKEVIVGGYPASGKTKMWEVSEMDANEETGYKSLGTYTSLVELNEEWENAPEEPKGYWYYDTTCGRVEKLNHNEDKEIDSSIGNCFETKEEAEKAVEKLKAWKRLKDKGFRFERWYWDDTQGHYILEKIDFVMDEYDGAETDLDLLFGGEE